MPNRIHALLAGDPVLLLFAVLLVGHLIGRLALANISLGPVAGVLFAGLVFGHFQLEIDPTIQAVGFALFIFSVGFEAGPRFFQVLAKDGLKYLSLALVVGGTGFVMTRLLTRVFDFAPGAAAGLLAGALTSTPTLAAANATVQGSTYVVPDGATRAEVLSNITTAYAITYIFGLIGLILLIRVLPRLLRIDLVAEARAAEREQASGQIRAFDPGDIITVARRVENPALIGVPLGELYERIAGQVTIQKIRRDGELLPASRDTVLERGDHVSIVAAMNAELRQVLEAMPEDGRIGPQVMDPDLLSYVPEAAQIVVMKPDAVGHLLSDLHAVEQHACFVSTVSRSGTDLPVGAALELNRGDVLTVLGPRAGLEELGHRAGHLELEADETDFLSASFGIVAGGLIGLVAVSIGGVEIGLGSAGGLLLTGLALGFLRSIHPVFARFPPAARRMTMDLGLLLFMACVGLRGGQTVVATLQASGLSLFVSGVLVTAVPVGVGYLYGRAVLGLNPVLLFGGITGAMTSGGALSVINEQSRSSVAGLGYTGAYAFANVILTIVGTLMMLL